MTMSRIPGVHEASLICLTCANLEEFGMATSSTNKVRQARALCEQGQWPDVLALAQKWHAENPADAKALFYQGVALAATGHFANAETAYRRALKLDPADFKGWNNLAALLFDSLNRPADAVQCLAQALKLDPGNKLGWANLASMHGQLGRHVQARVCAERALELDPEMVEAQLHRARAAQMLGQTEIVRAASEALAQLPPEKFRRTR
jgi:tetratricopeptide (TPR) repeat protein